MNLENSYNCTEAAEYLETSRTTFYQLIKRYDLKPAAKKGNMSLFDVADLKKIKDEMLKAQQ